MKTGIYGGSFNPIHKGHLTAAMSAARQLGLDRLFLIPASVPPHKTLSADSAAAQQRGGTDAHAVGKPGLAIQRHVDFQIPVERDDTVDGVIVLLLVICVLNLGC